MGDDQQPAHPRVLPVNEVLLDLLLLVAEQPVAHEGVDHALVPRSFIPLGPRGAAVRELLRGNFPAARSPTLEGGQAA